jgi:OST-HTH/LOTUS domain
MVPLPRSTPGKPSRTARFVSSDSDFSGLARRTREDGLLVGFGERKTPRPFVAACDRFVYTELLGPEAPGHQIACGEAAKGPGNGRQTGAPDQGRRRGDLRRHGLGIARRRGPQHRHQPPEFDPRTYGYGKLSDLVAALPLFEMEERRQGDGPSKALFIRDARKRTPRRGGGAGR